MRLKIVILLQPVAQVEDVDAETLPSFVRFLAGFVDTSTLLAVGVAKLVFEVENVLCVLVADAISEETVESIYQLL